MPTEVYLTKLPAHIALNRLLVEGAAKSGHAWDIDSPQFRHRAVMGLFPQIDSTTARADFNVLFRYEIIPGQAPYFLVQSTVEPEGGRIKNVIETKLIVCDAPKVGTRVAFRLAANTVTRDGKQAKPLPASPHDPLTNENPASLWIRHKLASALSNVEFTQFNRQVLGVNRRGKGASTRVVQVDTVDGVATVEDSKQLEQLLLYGVGRAKSYGCGLLSIMPLAG